MACAANGLVVGGGIAGLSAAIALGKAGIHCDVVEIADAPLGASLGISGRAAEALDELGVYDECYATGRPFTPDTTAASQNDAAGRLISAGPKRPSWPGAKTAIGVYRPTFLQILGDAARDLRAEVQIGITVDALEDTGNACLATMSNGEARRYDFVIGADGINSRTRTLVFPNAPKPAYSGQFSIRWMIPGPAIAGEGWYVGPLGRVGFYHLPHQSLTYVPAALSMPQWKRMSDLEVHALFEKLLDSYTAPTVLELRRHLRPDSELICRPSEWVFLNELWYKGRTLLIGDAAHTTTSHMGMGGGMAIEDAVVLAQCMSEAPTLADAYQAFMARRINRVRTVVETSLALSRLDQANAPRSENIALLSSALTTLSQAY